MASKYDDDEDLMAPLRNEGVYTIAWNKEEKECFGAICLCPEARHLAVVLEPVASG